MDISFKYLSFFLEDDERLEEIRKVVYCKRKAYILLKLNSSFINIKINIPYII